MNELNAIETKQYSAESGSKKSALSFGCLSVLFFFCWFIVCRLHKPQIFDSRDSSQSYSSFPSFISSRWSTLKYLNIINEECKRAKNDHNNKRKTMEIVLLQRKCCSSLVTFSNILTGGIKNLCIFCCCCLLLVIGPLSVAHLYVRLWAIATSRLSVVRCRDIL